MFGRRFDGRRITQDDPILALVPYLMPQRVDAQVHLTLQVDCDTLTKYIRQQRDKGNEFSYMDLIVASYIRAVSQFPELNRFVANKQVYARNSICVSLTIIREAGETIEETTIKLHFSPYDTIFDVHNKFREEIDKNRAMESVNNTDKMARFLISFPGLPTTIVAIARLLDRYGILPRFIINLSPFHTGMFITNMASIGMPHVNHHIYNFGTTSLFISMGNVLRTPVKSPTGEITYSRKMPLGIVVDERITSGAQCGRALSFFYSLVNDPTQMEIPPASIRTDIPVEKMPSLSSRRERRRERRQAKKALAGA